MTGLAPLVFLPKDLQGDAGPLQLAGKLRPIRLDTAAQPGLGAGPPEQAPIERLVTEFLRQRPAQPRRRDPSQIVLNGAARDAKLHRDRSVAQLAVAILQSQ